MIYSSFLSPAPKGAEAPRARAKEHFFLAAPMVVLAAACVVLGLAPRLAVERIFAPGVPGASEAIRAAGGGLLTDQGLWDPSQATILILLGLLGGAALVWVASWPKRVRVVRPFLAGEVPAAGDDRFRVPGTHFYRTLSRLPVVGALLAQGETGAMDLYHWSGRYGRTLVELLRRQHTGLISLYVAWALAGLAATLVYLLLSAGT